MVGCTASTRLKNTFSENVVCQKTGLYEGILDAVRRHEHAKLVPDRLGWVPVNFEQSYVVDICLAGNHYFIKSDYFKSGSLQKSSGDLREDFLKVWS